MEKFIDSKIEINEKKIDEILAIGTSYDLLKRKITIGDKNAVDGWLDELFIRDAIKELGEREKNILYLRFLQGKTQVEVAGEIGISQAQVSRLEKSAINRIKNSV